MKILGVSVLTILSVLSIALFIRLQSDEIKVYTVKRVHAYQSIDPEKSFSTDFIINQKDHLLTKENAIQSLHLSGEDETTMHLDSIKLVGKLHIDSEEFYKYQINFSLPYFTEDIFLEERDASLLLTLNNSDIHKVPLGSFTYQTLMHESSNLKVNAIHNLFGSLGGGVTSKGLYLTLENRYDSSLVIDEITLGTKDFRTNPYQMYTTQKAFDVERPMDYYFSENTEFNHEIKAFESLNITLPFVNESSLDLMYRYPIIITYQLNGRQHKKIIDDFMFINTSPYVIENLKYFQPVGLYDSD